MTETISTRAETVPTLGAMLVPTVEKTHIGNAAELGLVMKNATTKLLRSIINVSIELDNIVGYSSGSAIW